MDDEEQENVVVPVVKKVRTDYSGKEFNCWKILRYLYHIRTSPIWKAKCIYCGKIYEASLPKIKKKTQCECDEKATWIAQILIGNNILKEYAKQVRKEKETFRLSLKDLYRIYERQNRVDSDGNPLIFDYHWNYTRDPATCNYIWPDLERREKANSYNLNNCYFVANNKQRYPRRRSNQIKRRN